MIVIINKPGINSDQQLLKGMPQLFTSFLKEMAQVQRPSFSFYSNKKVIQSSVGLIFSCQAKEQIESLQDVMNLQEMSLLMVQRANYHKDSNANNIVFPGGQADPGQSDFTACKRQLMEQIGLNTQEQCIYVGHLPQNFYYAKKRGKSLYITCHIWITKSHFEPTLNSDQLSAFRWVPLQQITKQQSFTMIEQKKLGIYEKSIWGILSKYLKEKIISINMAAVNVGMSKQLWGISLCIYGYFLQMGFYSMKTRQQIKEIEIQEFQSMIEKLKYFQIRFAKGFFLGRPIGWLAQKWHEKYRVEPFTYPQVQRTAWSWKLIAFVAVLILVYFLL